MKNKLIFSFASVFMLLIISACSTNQGTNTSEPEISANPTWQFQQQLRSSGKVILSNQVELSFAISGQIEEMNVVDGDYVSRGDTLAKIDTRLLNQEISQRGYDLDVANANLERIKVKPSPADISRAEYELVAAETTRTLTAAQRTLQVADIASAQSNLEYLKSLPLPEDVRLAQAEVDRAQNSVVVAIARLERASLNSPINGNVIEVLVNAFEYTGAGQPIIRISDVNDLSVELEMDEIDVATINIGDNANVIFEALPGELVTGVVTRITPNTKNDDSKDFIVELKLLKIPTGLRWGMSAEATFD